MGKSFTYHISIMEKETLYDRFSGEKTQFELVGTYQKRTPAGEMVKLWIITSPDSEKELTTKEFELTFKREHNS